MAGWVKVGQTYTFRTVNFLDYLASPRKWETTHMSISFNGNRTVNIKITGKGKTVRVTFFQISWCHLPFDEEGGFYEIRMFLEDDTELYICKQLKPNQYGRNLYGMILSAEQYLFRTGTRTNNVNFGNVFDY